MSRVALCKTGHWWHAFVKTQSARTSWATIYELRWRDESNPIRFDLSA